LLVAFVVVVLDVAWFVVVAADEVNNETGEFWHKIKTNQNHMSIFK